MEELQIIKSANFGDIQCDIYGDGEEFYVTREQIGRSLEYANPRQAIANIHERKKERLDKYSVVLKLRTTDGKLYDTTVYNRKGIMEICRHSEQPKADSYMDWTWDIMDGLITGRVKIDTTQTPKINEIFNSHMGIVKVLIDTGKVSRELACLTALEQTEQQTGQDLSAYKKLFPVSEHVGCIIPVSLQHLERYWDFNVPADRAGDMYYTSKELITYYNERRDSDEPTLNPVAVGRMLKKVGYIKNNAVNGKRPRGNVLMFLAYKKG